MANKAERTRSGQGRKGQRAPVVAMWKLRTGSKVFLQLVAQRGTCQVELQPQVIESAGCGGRGVSSSVLRCPPACLFDGHVRIPCSEFSSEFPSSL